MSEPASHPRRTLLAGMMGNVMEWYDFGLYGYFAPILARLFFPSEDSLSSLIATFGVFAAGFLMRPVGAAIFGHFGDRIGRKRTLAASVLLMAIPTGLIGLLPTHAQAGVAAPILLTLMRLLQGASVGGEYTGSILFLVEHAPPERRGLVGSVSPFSASLGILLGSAVGAVLTSLVSTAALESWAWRLPFLFGFLIGGLGLFLRMGVTETPSFEALQKEQGVARFPIVEALKHDWKPLLAAVGLSVINGATFYLVFVFLTTYLSREVHIPIDEALTINTISMLVMAPMLLFFGWLSDRIGRKPPQVRAALAILVAAYPFFMLLENGDFAVDLSVQIAFGLFLAAAVGPQPTYLVELIPARARYTVLSVGYNLALGVFGRRGALDRHLPDRRDGQPGVAGLLPDGRRHRHAGDAAGAAGNAGPGTANQFPGLMTESFRLP